MASTRSSLPRQARTARCVRKAAILIWFALLLTVLLGMAGLVIDTGVLLTGQRQAQYAADAAAMAAANDLMLGRGPTAATATAKAFVQTYNLPGNPAPTVNIGPASGPYAGSTSFAEVRVTVPKKTFLIQLLGAPSTNNAGARAVAGFEAVSAGDGVVTLNPNAIPGLAVSGNGTLRVNGGIRVNSQGGGVDENGNPVLDGGNGYAATGGNQPGASTGVFATDIRIVGGVDNPADFQNIDPNNPTNVLHCNQLPIPDPLLDLATPTVSNGVDPTNRGTVSATSNNLKFTDPSNTNYVYTDPKTGSKWLVMHPGVYGSVSISGGNVHFVPGIYVLSPQQNTTNTIIVTGGTIQASRIMIYNTGNSYNPNTGLPDSNDGSQPPVSSPSALGDGTNYWGSVQLNTGATMTPLDSTNTTQDSWASSKYHATTISSAFDGMLFYQRRRNDSTLTVTGNASEGSLTGTLYDKWGQTSITGQGTYGAQFIVGSMKLSGQGNITLTYAGRSLGKAPHPFLVE